MADVHELEVRSYNMSQIWGKIQALKSWEEISSIGQDDIEVFPT